MASAKTTTKTIRVANETEEYFKNLPLNRMVECLHGLLESGRLRWNGEELIVNEKAVISDKLIADLEEIGGYFHMTVEELIKEFVRMLNEGEISCEKKVLSCALPIEVLKLRFACEKAGVTLDDVCKKVTGMIERGEM